MRTRSKICGLSNTNDIQVAVNAGVDALGFVFYPPSPRNVDLNLAKTLIQSVPGFVSTVALVVNEQNKVIDQILKQTQVNYLQFHGDESGETCRQFGVNYIKAIRVNDQTNFAAIQEEFYDAKLLLLDAYVEGIPGGTGQKFDWSLIGQLEKPWALAGGLTPENVKYAIEQVHPFAVDVSGGVEQSVLIAGKKGVKDPQKIIQFLQQVKAT
ncbi:MAG: phosphoribosylanthranilate isomerase [Saccharospirillaceae bacterium]|nr:phosphoribosylanthranilate isomerase [Pseudomonadales bacterium]NRB80482.1 phosphoribosylanthranilate isomerase [Saccharospirillaceae bacterium]